MAEENENVEETTDAVAAGAGDEAGTQDETPARAATSSEASPPSAPAEVLAPKERRARARAEKAAKVPTRPETSPEARQAERVATRAKKAEGRRKERVRARTKAREAHDSGVVTPPREHVSGRQKTQQGVVVSDKASKTITVRIDVARRHRRYSKIVRTSTTLHAHDEQGEAHIGDTVVVRECRPMSRTKRWRLVSVVERAQ